MRAAAQALRGRHLRFSLVFSPDGRTLATGSDDNTARLWEVATGKEITALRGHENWVKSVAFSPDGKLLATGSMDKTARLWEVATGRGTDARRPRHRRRGPVRRLVPRVLPVEPPAVRAETQCHTAGRLSRRRCGKPVRRPRQVVRQDRAVVAG